MSPRTVRAAVVALSLAGLVAAAPAAGALDRTPGLDAVKQAAHTAVQARVTALEAADAVVASSAFMGADQAVVRRLLQGDVAGLRALDAEIQADTALAEARADAQRVYTDYRVFALALPVAHLTRAADAVVAVAVPRLTAAHDRLQAAVTAKGTAALQPLLDDMKAQTDAARGLAAPLPAALAALTPATWNADHEVLQPHRAALETARADLRRARQDARQVVAGLR